MFHKSRILLAGLVCCACSSATTGASPSLSITDALDRGVDMFGIVADLPHNQYLGESQAVGTTRFPTVYRWQAQHTLLERGGTDVLISVEGLQLAGLPVLNEGTELDFVGGLYEDVRYRLAGTLNRISISGAYDVRLTVDWQMYDVESGSMVFTGASSGFARGQTLGLTRIRPNAFLDAFQDCLGELFAQPDFAAAIAPGADAS
ncbi:MAG: hypothetical protein Q8W45_02515 [Candidatus Palauibacterales bacterium]|jgi:hypothetical protein|nr:hypothetical protein [Candidatus Palauibacterales bacterium]MDP2482130.1 hypothetical protein [Candidatus Palauibacterales bacterium]